MKRTMCLFAGVLLVIFGLVAGEANASLYELKYVINGVTPPSGSDWLTATFTTVPVSGSNSVVDVTFTANTITGYKFSDIALNVDSSILPSSLTIVQQTKSGIFINPVISETTQNAQNLVGSGTQGRGFDVRFAFDTTDGDTNAFNLTDSVTYRISLSGTNLTQNSFNFLNVPTKPNGTPTGDPGTAHVGAHLQGYTVGGVSASAYISDVNPNPVPIPSAVWLLGAGVIGLIGIRRRYKK